MPTQKYRNNDLRDLVTIFEDRIAEAAHGIIKAEQTYNYILLRLSSKAIVDMRAIICLLEAGYPDEAMIITRNIYESFIIITFFEQMKQKDNFNEYVEKFYNNYEVIRLKALKYEAICHENTELEQQYDTEIKKYRSSSKKEYWWADENSFSDLQKKVVKNLGDPKLRDGMNALHFHYKFASELIHSNAFSMFRRIGEEKKIEVISTEAVFEGHEMVLDFASTCFGSIMINVFSNLQINDDEVFKKLSELIDYYKMISRSNR